MINQITFKTRKLKDHIVKINGRLKDLHKDKELTVFGVSKEEGVIVTGKAASKDLGEYIVVSEDMFVFNPYRVNIGSIGITPRNFEGVVSPAYVVFKTKDDLDSDFLFHYLKSDIGSKLINWYGNRGGVRDALRYDDLGEIDIPDITLARQKEIVSKLKSIQSLNDQFDEQSVTQSELLRKLRQTILQEAVMGKLVPQDPKDEPASILLERIKSEKEKLIKEGKVKKDKPLPPITSEEIPYELPKGWVWCRIEEVSDKITDGEHLNPPTETAGVPLLSAQNIGEKDLLMTDCRYVSSKFADRSRLRCDPEKGDILIVSRGGGVGRTIICKTDSVFCLMGSVILIKPSTELSGEFLSFFMRTAYGNNKLKYASGSTAQPAIYLTHVKRNYIIPLSPVAEQKRIVEKVDKLMKWCDELESNIESSRADAEKLMQAVLREAFEGTS